MSISRQSESGRISTTETSSGQVPTIETRVVSETAEFERLREQWNELLETSDSNGLFLTWEWLFTWWKHLRGTRRLHIVVVHSGPRLVAIAPLAVRPPDLTRLQPFETLEFLGSGIIGSDYLDFIIRRGAESQACHALVECLRRTNLMLELAQLSNDSCVARWIAAGLRRERWRSVMTKTNVCPFINLSGHSWDSYLATLGSEHRYNFGRRVKNLNKRFQVRFEPARSDAERRDSLALLVTLHNKRWQGRGTSEAFCAPSLLAFHEELSRLALERGWLRLFVLHLDRTPVAALYGFRYHRVFYFFQSGFDPGYGKHSVGLVTMGLAIKSAIEEGAAEYDLLHGDESYKFHWARASRALGRLELYPRGGHGLLCRAAVELDRAGRKLARRLLPKSLADRIAAGRALPMWSALHATPIR